MLNLFTLLGTVAIVVSYAIQPLLFYKGWLKKREYQVIAAHILLAPTSYGLCVGMAAQATYTTVAWLWLPALWVLIAVYCIWMIAHKIHVIRKMPGGP